MSEGHDGPILFNTRHIRKLTNERIVARLVDSYSYPHKTAYRHFESPLPLADLWQDEKRDSLFLYIHIPFCDMRCGFCNLFTKAKPEGSLVERYLRALRVQAHHVKDALRDATFAQLAIGGGTPTFLNTMELELVLDVAETVMGTQLGKIPFSIEVSPASVTPEKMRLLADRGVTRVSIGIETFIEAEAKLVNRPQENSVVERTLRLIRESSIPILNMDLIYGLPGQTVQTWLDSLTAALVARPEELYLYPLYVRPETGLGRQGRDWDDLRRECYREAQALLRSEGYSQSSMRFFRANQAVSSDPSNYRCQEDGMVGLGCGARSYTSHVHYSSEYAVRNRGILEILEDYVTRDAQAFARADYGFELSGDERRRRFVIQSLLSGEALAFADYTRVMHSTLLDDLPEIVELVDLGLVTQSSESIVLTDAGLERSDAIGPWLYSQNVKTLMDDYSWR